MVCSDKSWESNVETGCGFMSRFDLFKGAGVEVVQERRPAVDLKHFEDRRQAVANESRQTLQHRLPGYTLHRNVRQACRHQPLQGSYPADSYKYKLSSNVPTNSSSFVTTSTIMGQRHQFFAIARINNRYRTLAVIHNQWLYGHSAVRQCLNAMRILSATGNLQGIRRELKLAESKPDSFWEAKPRARGHDKGRVCSSGIYERAVCSLCICACTSACVNAGLRTA
jgi:hypothetical protein